MKVQKCSVCESFGRKTASDCRDEIYQTAGSSSFISLCYFHSVELFKLGQTSFFAKYQLEPVFESESAKKTHSPLDGHFVFNSFR